MYSFVRFTPGGTYGFKVEAMPSNLQCQTTIFGTPTPITSCQNMWQPYYCCPSGSWAAIGYPRDMERDTLTTVSIGIERNNCRAIDCRIGASTGTGHLWLNSESGLWYPFCPTTGTLNFLFWNHPAASIHPVDCHPSSAETAWWTMRDNITSGGR
jgi:hypothetical protein